MFALWLGLFIHPFMNLCAFVYPAAMFSPETAELTVKQLVPFGLSWLNTTVISLLLVIAAFVNVLVVARAARLWLVRYLLSSRTSCMLICAS